MAACLVCFLIGFAGLLWLPMHGTAVWVVALGFGPSTFPLGLTLVNLRTRTPAGQGLSYPADSAAAPMATGDRYPPTVPGRPLNTWDSAPSGTSLRRDYRCAAVGVGRNVWTDSAA
ncbi:MFS family transporter [Mycobacteroides abscessus subsp. abscessus]|nr:MFS family transporter [Mycobacteroides abscessus subsp. abscessus]